MLFSCDNPYFDEVVRPVFADPRDFELPWELLAWAEERLAMTDTPLEFSEFRTYLECTAAAAVYRAHASLAETRKEQQLLLNNASKIQGWAEAMLDSSAL